MQPNFKTQKATVYEEKKFISSGISDSDFLTL